MDKEHEINISINGSQKDLYTELIKTIELYEKCNYVRATSGDSPFLILSYDINYIIINCSWCNSCYKYSK